MRCSVLALLALVASACAARDAPVFGGMPSLGDPDACDSCMLGVRLVEDALCDPAAADFLIDFAQNKICPLVSKTPDQCNQVAEGLVPVAIEWFRATATPARLCSAAEVCGDRPVRGPPFLAAKMTKPSHRVLSDGMTCGMCKYVVTYVKTALSDPLTDDKVKQAALAACEQLPPDMAAACKQYVDQYALMLVALVETLDPDQTCTMVGACMEALVATVQPGPLPAGLAAAVGGIAMTALRPPPPPPLPAFSLWSLFGFGGPNEPVASKPCPEAAGGAAGGQQAGISASVRDSGAAKPLLPGMTWHTMPGEEQPGSHDHDMMPHPHHHDHQQQSSRPMVPLAAAAVTPYGRRPPSPANDACDICRVAVLEARALVSNPDMQQQVVTYAKALCASFPQYDEQCTAYVDQYAPLLFGLLEQELNPSTLCVQLGVCEKQTAWASLIASALHINQPRLVVAVPQH